MSANCRPILAGLFLSLAMSGCQQAESPAPFEGTRTGKALFNHYCADCHGADGSGNVLRRVPANWDTDLSRSQIIRKIRHGGPDSNMPAFEQLSRSDARAIAEHLRNLGPFASGEPDDCAEATLVRDCEPPARPAARESSLPWALD